MDELDHMYDDMQDRLYEIDKNRKVNPKKMLKFCHRYDYLQEQK